MGLRPGRLPGRGNTQAGVNGAGDSTRAVQAEVRCGSLGTEQGMKDLGKECGSNITSSTKSSLTQALAQGGMAGSALSRACLSSDLHQRAQARRCAASQPLGHKTVSPRQPNERRRAQLLAGGRGVWGSLNPGTGSGQERVQAYRRG